MFIPSETMDCVEEGIPNNENDLNANIELAGWFKAIPGLHTRSEDDIYKPSVTRKVHPVVPETVTYARAVQGHADRCLNASIERFMPPENVGN